MNSLIMFINSNVYREQNVRGIYGRGIQYCEVEARNERQRGYKVLQKLKKTSSEIQNEYAK